MNLIFSSVKAYIYAKFCLYADQPSQLMLGLRADQTVIKEYVISTPIQLNLTQFLSFMNDYGFKIDGSGLDLNLILNFLGEIGKIL